MSAKYKPGHRHQKIEVITIIEANKYMLSCECGFVFDKVITDCLPRMCKRCYTNPAVDKGEYNSSRGYTQKEQEMIKRFEDNV